MHTNTSQTIEALNQAREDASLLNPLISVDGAVGTVDAVLEAWTATMGDAIADQEHMHLEAEHVALGSLEFCAEYAPLLRGFIQAMKGDPRKDGRVATVLLVCAAALEFELSQAATLDAAAI